MALTRKDVEQVATLARLELTEEERETYTRQLDAILGYMRTLEELDTAGVRPTSHVLPLTNVMREDTVQPFSPRGELLDMAPDQEKGHFKVPKVIEGAG